MQRFVREHQQLFTFQAAEHLHPHDRLVARLFFWAIPQWFTPNVWTTVRLICTPVVFFFIAFGRYDIGIILFVLVAFTDVIDGSLARVRGQITQFGILFDPLCDKLLIGSLVCLLALKYVGFWLGVGVIVFEIIFIITAWVAKVKFHTVRMANRWGKIKMLCQVIAVCLTLLGLAWGHDVLFSVAAWMFGFALGFAVISLVSHGV